MDPIYERTIIVEGIDGNHRVTNGFSLAAKAKKASLYFSTPSRPFTLNYHITPVAAKALTAFSTDLRGGVSYRRTLANICTPAKTLVGPDVINFTNNLKSMPGTLFINDNVAPNQNPRAAFDQVELKGENLIFIPYVIPKNHFGKGHIVLIVIDEKKKEILYYDSQGLSSDDPVRIECLGGLNMRNELVKIAQKMGGSVTLIENRTQTQEDPINCGVYVLGMIHKIIHNREIPFQDLVGLGFGRNPVDMRRELSNLYVTDSINTALQDWTRVVDLYNGNATLAKIASELSLSKETVLAYLQSSGRETGKFALNTPLGDEIEYDFAQDEEESDDDFINS